MEFAMNARGRTLRLMTPASDPSAGGRVMSSGLITDQHGNQRARERDTLRDLDGAERVAALPLARMVALAPGAQGEEEPSYVFIAWSPDAIECACPGSALWRAVLAQYLAKGAQRGLPRSTDDGDAPIREAVMRDLRRFPSLDVWLRWRDHDRSVPERRR
jgi:hypothetical protein